MGAPTVGPEEAAYIIPSAASLMHMLTGADGWPDKLRDAIQRIAAWSQEFAGTSRVDHRHWVLDAESDMRGFQAGYVGYIPVEAGDAIAEAYRLAAYVRGLGSPTPGDLFEGAARVAASDTGVSYAQWLADEADDEAYRRSTLVVQVLRVDTDRPEIAGIDGLSATQLRALHHQVARLINAKTPPPPEPTRRPQGRVAAEDAALPLRYSRQQVA